MYLRAQPHRLQMAVEKFALYGQSRRQNDAGSERPDFRGGRADGLLPIFVLFMRRPAYQHMVGDSIPGVVDASEEQHQRRGSDAE